MAHPNFDVLAHIENKGDVHGGPDTYVGTRGENKSMEGFSVTFSPRVDGIGLRYRAHLRGSGDTDWVGDGTFVGTRGKSKPVEGFAIELSGPKLAEYDVQYMTHVENQGDTGWSSNGEFCGTRGRTLTTQGIAVRIVPRVPNYVSIASKATSGSGKPLLITAPARADDKTVRVSQPTAGDLQVWDRRPVKGNGGFALISKAHPTLCLARGQGQPVVLKSVSVIDTDDTCVWRDDNVQGPYNAINTWTDWELKLNMSGNPPYQDRDNALILYKWDRGAPNELWRTTRSNYSVVVGTDDRALDALSEAIYRGCYPNVFRGSFTIGQAGIKSVGYDIRDAPRFELKPSALFHEQARERFVEVLGASGAQVDSLAAAVAASTVTVAVHALTLSIETHEQAHVDGSMTIAASVRANANRSVSLELTSGRVSLPQRPDLEGAINTYFVPLLLAYLNATVLKPIAIPPLELLGVEFTAPLLATQHPHLIAATTQIPDSPQLPPPSRWPQGKVFAGVAEPALNAVGKAALDKVRPSGDWNQTISIKICDLGLKSHYDVYFANPSFTVSPSSGNAYRVRIDLGGNANFSLGCGILSGGMSASANGSATVTAGVSVDHRNHVIVTFGSIDDLSIHWHVTDSPFWLPGYAIGLILEAFNPVVRTIVTAALRGTTFDVYSIPTIEAPIAGKTFAITLNGLELGSTEDGARKPLVLATGLASVKMR